MQVAEAQREVRSVYLGGALGQLVSGVLWLASAAAGTWGTPRQAMLVLFLGGMLIFPLTTLGLRLLGRRAALSASNPLGKLAMQVAFTVPIGLVVANKDARPGDYAHLARVPRPSHADYTYRAKYGTAASSGGGRASARETVARVAAGTVAEIFRLRPDLTWDLVAGIPRDPAADILNFNCNLDETLGLCVPVGGRGVGMGGGPPYYLPGYASYIWRLQSHTDGHLYAGTLDLAGYYGYGAPGFDLWRTPDGESWTVQPVALVVNLFP